MINPNDHTEISAEDKKKERLERLKNLHLKRNEARKKNHAEVIEEDKRNKLPDNWASRQKRLEWEEETESFNIECESRGENPDRMKLLDVPADVAGKLEGKRLRKKQREEQGFADFEQASYKKYQRLTNQMKSDLTSYQKEKAQMGELFYPGKDTLGLNQRKDSQEAIDRMAKDVEDQISKKAKHSRRRTYNDDADIDYINERNKRFNEKIERFYGKYTSEIKQNLERGTAL